MTIGRLILVFAVALALRCGAWAGLGLMRGGAETPALPDEQQYWGMARSLAEGAGLRDELGFRAGRMPLFPAMLAPLTQLPDGVVWARLLLCVLGAAGAAAAAMLAAKCFGARVGLIAGVLVSADPYLVYFSSLILTETPFLLAILILWHVSASTDEPCLKTNRAVWLKGASCGLSAAACVYLRETGAALAVALAALVLIRHKFKPRACMMVLTAAGVVFLLLLPWAWRNHRQLDSWIFLTTRGGITLYDGVHPQATGRSDLADIKAMPAVRDFVDRGDEVGWDAWFRRASWQSIRDDFAQVARLAGVKLKRTWNVVPNLEEGRSTALMAVSAIWTLPVYALALLGVYHTLRRADSTHVSGEARAAGTRDDRWRVAVLMLPAVVVTIMHAVLVGSVRYRLPAMPMLEVLAAAAIVQLADGRARRRIERT
ncbi:MAG: glycosyltransferase family 39 protein [Phycisphaerales bacterium]|nr:glycosyltransferase family 39 protein [Phycisphaerales bacterium]